MYERKEIVELIKEHAKATNNIEILKIIETHKQCECVACKLRRFALTHDTFSRKLKLVA